MLHRDHTCFTCMLKQQGHAPPAGRSKSPAWHGNRSHQGTARARQTSRTYSGRDARHPSPGPSNTLVDDGDHRMLPEWMKGHVTAGIMAKLCHGLGTVNTAKPKIHADGSTKKNIGNHYAEHEVDVFPTVTLRTRGYKRSRFITMGVTAYDKVYDGFHLYRRTAPSCYSAKIYDIFSGSIRSSLQALFPFLGSRPCSK